jgi:hypothetical protein
MRECPTCGTLNGLDASDAEPIDCRACQQLVVFPDLPDTIVACYACVRRGRAALTKDTQLGMISWEQAFDGVTHGGPGLSNPAFDLVPREGGWAGARLPEATMFELLRTPTYSTIQGERWPFCCKAPMVFLGRWSRDQFNREAPDGDGHALFQAMVANPIPGLWEDQLHDVTGIYAFRCATCDRRMAHWDIA